MLFVLQHRYPEKDVTLLGLFASHHLPYTEQLLLSLTVLSVHEKMHSTLM